MRSKRRPAELAVIEDYLARTAQVLRAEAVKVRGAKTRPPARER